MPTLCSRASLMWLSGKNQPASAKDVSLIPRSGRYLGEGNSNPFQYSCLGNTKDRGAWWATVHDVAKSDMNLAAELTPFVPWRDPIFTFQGYMLTNTLENWKQSN